MGHFCPPGSGSGSSDSNKCGSMRIRIHNPESMHHPPPPYLGVLKIAVICWAITLRWTSWYGLQPIYLHISITPGPISRSGPDNHSFHVESTYQCFRSGSGLDPDPGRPEVLKASLEPGCFWRGYEVFWCKKNSMSLKTLVWIRIGSGFSNSPDPDPKPDQQHVWIRIQWIRIRNTVICRLLSG